MGEIFRWERPGEELPFTGERFTSDASGQIEIEHLHRYFLARALCRGRDVLDIASGEGYGAALIAQVARSVVGVEVDARAAAHARRAYARPNLTFIQGDARAIPLKSASVDVVVSFETIEHLYEQENFVAEARRVLRADGVFIVSTPDRDVYSPTDSRANPYHVRELTIAEFERVLRARFDCVECLLQRPMVGSVLLPDRGVAGSEAPLTFERRGDGHFEGSIGLPRAPYVVALASANPVWLPAASVYIETGAVGFRAEALAQIQRLEAALARVTSDKQALEAQLAEARAENERLARLTTLAGSENERLETMLAAARGEFQRLEAVFGTARAEHERVEGLFRTTCSENERLERLFGAACTENQRLETLFTAACTENQRLETLFTTACTENQRLEGLFGTACAENRRLDTLHNDALSELAQLTARVGDAQAKNESVNAANERLERDLSQAQTELAHAATRHNDASRNLAEVSARLHQIETSTTWRALAPIRGIIRRFRVCRNTRGA